MRAEGPHLQTLASDANSQVRGFRLSRRGRRHFDDVFAGSQRGEIQIRNQVTRARVIEVAHLRQELEGDAVAPEDSALARVDGTEHRPADLDALRAAELHRGGGP